MLRIIGSKTTKNRLNRPNKLLDRPKIHQMGLNKLSPIENHLARVTNRGRIESWSGNQARTGGRPRNQVGGNGSSRAGKQKGLGRAGLLASWTVGRTCAI